MKKTFILATVAFCSIISIGQNNATVNDDTTRIKAGNSQILIISNEGDDFDWEDESIDTVNKDEIAVITSFDLGMNGYLSSSNSLELPVAQSLMELDYSKSRSFGVNFMLKGADILHKHIYFSPGIGFNWNSYSFKNNIVIPTANDTTEFMLDSNITFDKYKLKSAFIQVPVLIGFRLGDVDKNPFGLQFGVIGGYKLGSKVKEKYAFNETNVKNNIKDDYNLNPFKMEAIARMSFKQFGIYAKYSMTSLFEGNKAPAVYPFSVGFTINGF